VAPLSDFIIKWSPLIAFLLVVFKLVDKLFESASVNFLAKGFVSICNWMWKDPFKEPVHKGIIIEAPVAVQRALYKLFAWVQGLQALVLFLFTFLAL